MAPTVLSCVLLVAGASACSNSTSPLDAGPADAGAADTGPDAGAPDVGQADAGEVDAGPPYACEQTMRVDGVLDDSVSVMVDTTMTELRPRDLGPTCGNPSAEIRWARQQALEFHVPGSGQMAVSFDTDFAETDSDFNTVVQVREACERVPTGGFPPTCFDDIGPTNFRSRGSFAANGGDVVYIIVTGYSSPPAGQMTRDEGRVRIDLRTEANAAPTISAGSFNLALDDTYIRATGADPDQNAVGVALSFYASGELLDIYGDGVADEADVYSVAFDSAPSTVDFTDATAIVRAADVGLAAYLRSAMATDVQMRIYDAGWALSAPLEVPIAEATLAGLGEMCDGISAVCNPAFDCISGICTADAASIAACDAAIPLTLPAITTQTVAVGYTGTTGAGMGSFAPQAGCVQNAQGTEGSEAIYSVEVPASTQVDLLVTTKQPGTADTDTILYLRAACVDPAEELACNDDRAPQDLQSDIEARDLGPGTYFVFVEAYGGVAMGTAPHELLITARPVLSTGAACDNAELLNRCAGGPCAAGVCP